MFKRAPGRTTGRGEDDMDGEDRFADTGSGIFPEEKSTGPVELRKEDGSPDVQPKGGAACAGPALSAENSGMSKDGGEASGAPRGGSGAAGGGAFGAGASGAAGGGPSGAGAFGAGVPGGGLFGGGPGAAGGGPSGGGAFGAGAAGGGPFVNGVPPQDFGCNAPPGGGGNMRWQQMPPEKSESVGFGIASLVLGILSLLLFCTCINWITGILAIIFGIIQIAQSRSKGLAVGGIVTAGLSMLFTVILYIILMVMGMSADSYQDEYYNYYSDYYEDYFEDGFDSVGEEFL